MKFVSAFKTALCKMFFYRRLIGLMGIMGMLMLSGCKVALYSGLQEKEANEMIAVLMRENIRVSKSFGKKNTVVLSVAESHMADAITILKREGYPKDTYANMGEVFEKKGIISSPLEEHARYIYAMSQDISDTLSRLDGVLEAKVHVVLPELDTTGQLLTPSSASVFIKHKAAFNLTPFVPQFKNMVSNSIGGLDYSKISVALFPSVTTNSNAPAPLTDVLHIKVHPRSKGDLWALLGLLFVLLAASVAVNAWYWRQSQLKARSQDGAENVAADI